jgi:hypothetical protein
LAGNWVVNTSSCRIAMSGGTCRSIWASYIRSDNSENCITFVGYALIWWF